MSMPFRQHTRRRDRTLGSAPTADDITRWIRHLADSSPKDRAQSASRLYMVGLDLCLPLLNQWKTDAEFNELVRPQVTGSPYPDLEPAVIVVGIAVQPENFEKIRAANGMPRLAEVPPDQDAREFELHFESRIALDILTTRQPFGSGAIAQYLEKSGEGIQQVEIYVRDVDRATEILRAGFGLEPIYLATRAGADGTRVNFFLVPMAAGKKVLIEFVEARSEERRQPETRRQQS